MAEFCDAAAARDCARNAAREGAAEAQGYTFGMGKPITFDWHPHPTRAITIARFIVLLAFGAIVPAGIGWGEAGAGVVFAVAILLLLLCLLLREIAAIVRHTRFALLDLWILVAVCGSVAGGVMKIVNESLQQEAKRDLMEARWATFFYIGALVFVFVLRGFYGGLRLAMWLKADRFAPRTGLLFMGLLGYLAGVAWKVCAVTGTVVLIGMSKRSPPPLILWKVLPLLILAGVLFFGLERVHLRYRKRAQENYDADRFALGHAGRLEPQNGTYRMSDLFENLQRLAGFPPENKKKLK